MPVTSCIITFGRNALTIKNDASFASMDKQAFVNLGDLNSGALGAPPYITYEPDFWLLDGGYKFKPVTPVHTGLWSEQMSDEFGDFGDVIILTITFDNVYSTNGLTLRGVEYSDDYISFMNIEFFDSGDISIRDDDYFPTNWEFSTGQAVANFKKIVIKIWGTNNSYRYARLTSMDFDELITFAGDEVKSARLVEQIDPLSVTIPIGEIEFTLFSSAGDFSIIEPAGVYADLQQKEPIEVYEQIDGDTIFIGRFYLDTWESKNENEATFKAYDAIGLLENTPYLGFLGGVDASLVEDFIDEVFVAAGLDYELDTFWTTFGCDQHVPPGTARDALQELLFQIYTTVAPTRTAVAIAARSNRVTIPAFPLVSTLTEFDYTIAKADQTRSELSLKPLVTDIRVIGHSRMTEADTITVFNASLTAGDHLIIFETAMDNLGIVGGTITTTRANYVIINVASPGNVTITGKRWIFPTKSLTIHNTETPASALANIITADGSLVAYPDSTMTARANTMIGYYNQRYLLKTTLFAPRAAVGDSVLIDVQDNRQLAGYIERMETDLAGGFVARTEIVGVIVPL